MYLINYHNIIFNTMYCLNVSVHTVQSTSSSMTIQPCTADGQIEQVKIIVLMILCFDEHNDYHPTIWH